MNIYPGKSEEKGRGVDRLREQARSHTRPSSGLGMRSTVEAGLFAKAPVQTPERLLGYTTSRRTLWSFSNCTNAGTGC